MTPRQEARGHTLTCTQVSQPALWAKEKFDHRVAVPNDRVTWAWWKPEREWAVEGNTHTKLRQPRERSTPRAQAGSSPRGPRKIRPDVQTTRPIEARHLDPGVSQPCSPPSTLPAWTGAKSQCRVRQRPVWTSGPQPFWHQGPVSWKTICPWTAVGGWRWGVVQAVMPAMGGQQMKLCSLAAHLLLCGPVPNRLCPATGPRPGGLGTPGIDQWPKEPVHVWVSGDEEGSDFHPHSHLLSAKAALSARCNSREKMEQTWMRWPRIDKIKFLPQSGIWAWKKKRCYISCILSLWVYCHSHLLCWEKAI